MLTCQHFHEQHITSERRKQLDANFGTKRMLQTLHDVTESVQKYKADIRSIPIKKAPLIRKPPYFRPEKKVGGLS